VTPWFAFAGGACGVFVALAAFAWWVRGYVRRNLPAFLDGLSRGVGRKQVIVPGTVVGGCGNPDCDAEICNESEKHVGLQGFVRVEVATVIRALTNRF